MFAHEVSESILSKMEKSEFLFHLTGSRYFVGRGSNDADYFTLYTEQVEHFLRELGFSAISKREYGDLNCTLVMRGWDDGGLQIDVQLVKDVELKIQVQEKLKAIGLTHPTKEEWNFAFQLLK
ncbi:MAG TPA: hypothetical protein VNX68_06320 [Nitrosopumilaceae archaeon]|jgi:hypothetical protein|nr:hypothetical protein [Nitrosopumilaceae archaeon]